MCKIEFGGIFIETFFNNLKKEKIDYVVLRNYEGLPKANSSKDVDILIDEKNLFVTNKILLDLYKELDFNFIWENKLDYLTGYAFVKKMSNIIYSVKIDIFHGLKWRGLNYLDNNIIFNEKKEHNSLYIPNKSHESFIMILYYILYAKNIKEKYFFDIYAYKNDREHFQQILLSTLDASLSNKIVKSLDNENILKLIAYRKNIIKNIIVRNLKSFPIMSKNIIRHIYCEVFQRNSFGVIILFNGECQEKDLISKIFIDLGISIKVEKKLSTIELIRLLRKNPLIVLEKKDLSNLQRKIFLNKIINIQSLNLETIFFNIQNTIKKDKI